MRLIPRRPPGNVTRKTAAFRAEIQRLHSEGYTCEAIREALADAGVVVSNSTVWRELGRRAPDTEAPPSTTDSATQVPSSPPAMLASDARSGRDIAEGFLKGRISNPLLRARKAP